MMVKGGQNEPLRYDPITDTNSGTGFGRNFLSLIIKFAPVELDIYMEINILVEHCIPYIYYS